MLIVQMQCRRTHSGLQNIYSATCTADNTETSLPEFVKTMQIDKEIMDLTDQLEK